MILARQFRGCGASRTTVQRTVMCEQQQSRDEQPAHSAMRGRGDAWPKGHVMMIGAFCFSVKHAHGAVSRLRHVLPEEK